MASTQPAIIRCLVGYEGRVHETAFNFVRQTAWRLPPLYRVLELGSRTINGTVKEIFTVARKYVGVDLVEGPGVDIVADAADPAPLARLAPFDAVVCCEVFEHAQNSADICRNAALQLRPYGVFIVTCAGPERAPHSCEGGPLWPEEYYQGVDGATLRRWLTDAGFRFALVDDFSNPGDTYAVAVK